MRTRWMSCAAGRSRRYHNCPPLAGHPAAQRQVSASSSPHLDILHDDVDVVGCLHNFVQADDVWVHEEAQDLDLAPHCSVAGQEGRWWGGGGGGGQHGAGGRGPAGRVARCMAAPPSSARCASCQARHGMPPCSTAALIHTAQACFALHTATAAQLLCTAVWAPRSCAGGTHPSPPCPSA